MLVNPILSPRMFRHRAMLISLILLALVAGTVMTRLVLAKNGWLPLRNRSSSGSNAVRQEKKPAPQIMILRVILRTYGFDPREIIIPKGTYLLSVNDRTEIDDLAFEFNRVGQGKLHEVRGKKERPEWSQLFELNPGDYQLVVAGKPNWICKITVTAQDN